MPAQTTDTSVRSSAFALAVQPSVAKRAAKIALIVGSILAIINHGDAMMTGTLTLDGFAKILLTFCVPYCVSTYSSVQAIRDKTQSVEPR